MIGIIGGTGLEDFMEESREKEVEAEHGVVPSKVRGNLAFINRHGKDKETPPHLINHQANIKAFQELEVEAILGIGSVGSLKKGIPPGSILIPHDYINFHPPTFFESRVHITPGFDEELRKKITREARETEARIIPQGIYFQTRGPRLETKAEVNMLKEFADVVGMTLASEATLAQELEIPYAGICQVDNYAHGLEKEKIDFREIMEKAGDRENLAKLLQEIVKRLS